MNGMALRKIINHISCLKGEILAYFLFSAGIVAFFAFDDNWKRALALSVSFAGVLLGIYNYQLSKDRKRKEKINQLLELSKK